MTSAKAAHGRTRMGAAGGRVGRMGSRACVATSSSDELREATTKRPDQCLKGTTSESQGGDRTELNRDAPCVMGPPDGPQELQQRLGRQRGESQLAADQHHPPLHQHWKVGASGKQAMKRAACDGIYRQARRQRCRIRNARHLADAARLALCLHEWKACKGPSKPQERPGCTDPLSGVSLVSRPRP
jgi:hypothetical protein